MYDVYTESVNRYKSVVEICEHALAICNRMKLAQVDGISIGARTAVSAAKSDLVDAQSSRLEVMEMLLLRVHKIDTTFASLLTYEINKENERMTKPTERADSV